jgi:hypothetical protein
MRGRPTCGLRWASSASSLLLALACGLVLVSAGASSGGTRALSYTRPGTPKLDSQLGQIAQTAALHGAGTALMRARADALQTQAGSVRVIVVAKPGERDRAAAAIAGSGGKSLSTAGALTEALVPPAALRALAASSSVADVRPPLLHVADAVDEGVHSSNAGTWHAAGLGGSGVKIGIVDLGFFGYGSLLGSALPASVTAVDHCSNNLAAAPPIGTEHGTAVAEIVHQMAPDAQLYLFCVDSEVGLALAEQDAIADGVKIINHSVSWFDTSRGDGSGAAGTPDAIVADARAHGILWVNSAGNDGLDHWAGSFTPAASDPQLNDFGSDHVENQVVIDAGEQACVALKWDDWPVTSEDFDLLLVRDSDHAVVAGSANDQADGPAAPYEELCYTNAGGSPAQYGIEIVRYSAASTPRLDLYYLGEDELGNRTTEGVTEPASSPAALAVGAACWQTGDLEPFSSVGPTIDGRTKPDLVASDSVSTVTYGAAVSGAGGCGTSGFTGTSASSPQVAGAAALLLQQDPTLTPGPLTAALEVRALGLQTSDAGPVADSNETGNGPLRLGVTSPIGTIAFDYGGTTYVGDGNTIAPVLSANTPSWSSDGTRLLGAVAGAGLSIFNVSPATSSHVFGSAGGDVQPAWEAGGGGPNVLYVDQSTPGIVQDNYFNGATTHLTSSSADHDPEEAPDGSAIAFLKTTAGSTDIWLMNLIGTVQTQLTTLGTLATPTATGGELAWSPDSSKLAFVVGSNPYAIWVVDANGSNPHALTTTASAFGPSWSPDGTQILFVDSGNQLDVMNADGSNAHHVNDELALSQALLNSTSWTGTDRVFSLGQVVLTGAPQVGEALEAQTPPWVGAPAVTFAYDWERCQPYNLCNYIPGATNSTYTLTSADLGFYIRAQVEATHGTTAYSLSDATDAVVPAAPYASSLPTISGTAESGDTLALDSAGSWSGSPAFTYSWERCDPDGGSCSPIGGATASSYELTASDVGSTIRLAVTGTAAGGANVATSASSGPVGGTPAGGGGSSGGGGGGGGPLDLATSVSASAAQIAPGGAVSFRVVVADLTGTPATHLHVTVSLPAGAVVGSTSTDRGSGCVPGPTSGTLSCDLDYLAGSPTVGNVLVLATLPNAGPAVLTASAAADQPEANVANNTASVTVQVGSPPAPLPPVPPAPYPGPPAPVLRQLNARTLSGIRHRTSETVDGRFTTNEALHLRMTVTRLRSTRRLELLKGSRLAGVTTRATTATAVRFAAHGGSYSFHAILRRSGLTRGATYVLRIGATNTAGKSTVLSVRFRA